ncbi:MAG: Fic family protein [Spartobacteria bacterium]|nr:Fic family protein [Spartobacteria bacterium]
MKKSTINHQTSHINHQAVHYHYNLFPPDIVEWNELIPLIGPANAAIARYDGLLEAIPNAAILLSPLTTQEAVLSSRIEGTQATMGEVLEFEAEAKQTPYAEEKRNDIQEVLNYRRALRHAMTMLETIPLSLRVVLETHRVLLDSVRGHGKAPGQLRKIPNWIGPAGCTMENARYVPISADKLPDAMTALEKYIHAESVPDILIQLAVIHAEFEALHPFLDGNGRLGRMIVPLFLWQAGLIRQPMFYISAFLEENRDEYYERLLAVSRDGNWSGWCAFFLRALCTQARENEKRASTILELYNAQKTALVALTHSQYTIHALDWIFEKPIFKSNDFVESAGIPAPTARRILSLFRGNDILTTLVEASGRRPATYAFSELLNIAEGHDVF